ncbi:MAG: helix-turn-helix transcriptional regulator [Clostridia bacterium]|nr:helix-turn-helix transcriptional regulator [Clostridia bacterium]
MTHRIREVRIGHSMTQQELAEAIGVTQTAITKWETGSCKPSLENMVKAARALKCSMDDLIMPDERDEA